MTLKNILLLRNKAARITIYQVIIPKLIDYGKDFINTLLLVLDQYHQVDSEVFF